MIADDHPLTPEILRMRLEQVGIEVLGEATNGDDAVRLVEKLQPSLAKLDAHSRTGAVTTAMRRRIIS